MIVFPNCKINLGLYITSKRPDGYHNLETIFYPVPLTDALEVIENKNPGSGDVTYSSSGLPVNTDPEGNLCIKAYNLLKKDFPGLPPIRMHLHKVIPMGAGLGGGSSDGAFALQLLNEKFNLRLMQNQLLDYSLSLGSDCPFFILNQPCIGKGRGEILKPTALNLKGYKLVLVHPGIHVSTRDAFAAIDPHPPKLPVETLAALPVEEWKNNLSNDFEPAVFLRHPVLSRIKSSLYEAGADYAAMSGSGSTIFGLFKEGKTNLPPFEKDYFIQQLELQ